MARSSEFFNSKNGYITFSTVEKSCDIDSNIWGKHYTLANRVIHVSPQGTFGRLSNTGMKGEVNWNNLQHKNTFKAMTVMAHGSRPSRII